MPSQRKVQPNVNQNMAKMCTRSTTLKNRLPPPERVKSRTKQSHRSKPRILRKSQRLLSKNWILEKGKRRSQRKIYPVVRTEYIPYPLSILWKEKSEVKFRPKKMTTSGNFAYMRATAAEPWSLHDFTDIGENIGAGGFGRVKRCFSTRLGENVAVKIMNKKDTRRKLGAVGNIDLNNEGKIHLQLHHQNICKAFGQFTDNGSIYLVMELGVGDLYTHVAQHQYDDERLKYEAQSIIQQIVTGVAYMHGIKGFIHVDLKPENILLTSQLQAKITDFGSAIKMVDYRHPHSARHTVGSLQFQPPEMLDGRDFDSTMDVWAIGVIAYFILTRTNPFFRTPEPGTVNLQPVLRSSGFEIKKFNGLTDSQIEFFQKIFVPDRENRPLIHHLPELNWIKNKIN